MRTGIIAFLVFWFPIQDLVLAALYNATGSPLVGTLAHVRDVIVLSMALLAFIGSRIPRRLFYSMVLYGLFVFASMPIGLWNGAPFGVVIASAAILLLPPMLVLAGYWAHRTPADFDRTLNILIIMAIASAAFGAWDIMNTSFWTDVIAFPKYMIEVKGVLVVDHDTLLPMNFFHDDLTGTAVRRAAGLLAAPLAQGSFLATMGLLAMARFYRPSRIFLGVAIFTLCAFGVFETDTRGAMIYLAVSVMVYIITLADTPKKFGIALAGSAAAILTFVIFQWRMLVLALTLGDVSALDHAQALVANITNIGSVLFIGNGVGMAGSYAGFATGVTHFGGYGGESAIFSVAYQLGVPGAIVFLTFFTLLMIWLWRARKTMPQPYAKYASALLALGIGSTTTFISSEHIFTFSGFAQYWLLVGGLLGVANRQRIAQARETQSYSALPMPAQ